jgi:hypothetical protein
MLLIGGFLVAFVLCIALTTLLLAAVKVAAHVDAQG